MEVRIEDQLIIASFILFLSLFVSTVLTAGSFVHFPVLTLIKITHSYLKQHLIFILRSLNIADWNQVTHLKRCQKKKSGHILSMLTKYEAICAISASKSKPPNSHSLCRTETDNFNSPSVLSLSKGLLQKKYIYF